MTEDDGYETIVPDANCEKIKVTDPEVFKVGSWINNAVDANEFCDTAHRAWPPITNVGAIIWKAAYNQALKDAAELIHKNWIPDTALRVAKDILSLGDKDNG